MSYATVGQVKDVLARDLTHVAATAASLSDPQIQEQLDDATSQVDSALGYTYPTPFGLPYPAQVVAITRDIAAYLADLVYRGTMDYATGNSPMLLRYQRASQLLKDLASGAAKLNGWPPAGDVADQPSTQDGQISAGYCPTDPALTRSLDLRGPDRLGWPAGRFTSPEWWGQQLW